MPQGGFDLRIGFHQLLQKAAQAQKVGSRIVPMLQASAHFVTQRCRRALHVARRGERPLGVRQKRLTIAREREPVRGPRKQRDAQRLLQMS